MSLPVFIENSRIPIWLSHVSPIDIGAITLGPIVISRDTMSDTTKNHETIHWQQYLETGIIGFLILYLVFWIVGMIKYRDGAIAYHQIPFEQEAYSNQSNFSYLDSRKRYVWMKYSI